jgi:Activator of Hsp90 ATPase homolog 1-like protein
MGNIITQTRAVNHEGSVILELGGKGAMNIAEAPFDLSQTVMIHSEIGDAYRALIGRLSEGNSTPDNRPMPMVLEQWPGGRWFRDLGEGQGHLWGFVQVIKPPTLLEIQGPLFMSYAVAGHVQFRLAQVGEGVELTLRHRVLGSVEDEHRRGVVGGWNHMLQQTKRMAERGRA